MPFGATSDTAIGVSKDAAAVRNAVAANPFRLSVSGAAGASGGDCVGANATGGVMQPAESFDCAKEAAAMGSVDRLLHILFLTRPEFGVCSLLLPRGGKCGADPRKPLGHQSRNVSWNGRADGLQWRYADHPLYCARQF